MAAVAMSFVGGGVGGGCGRGSGSSCGGAVSSAAPAVSSASSSPAVEWLGDAELARVEDEERQRLARLGQQIEDLKEQFLKGEARRRLAYRELLFRSFAATPVGRVPAASVLPFLDAVDALRWLQASPAVEAHHRSAASLRGGRCAALLLHHLRTVGSGLKPSAADALARRLVWPAVETLSVDLGSGGWVPLLTAAIRTEKLELTSLRALSVVFPAGRSASAAHPWQVVEPLLSQLGGRLTVLRPALRELVLHDLRSPELLSQVLFACGRQLRVCRVSLLGPESRRKPLQLPAAGLPSLECLMIKHRDFCEQRASRQERLLIPVSQLLACVQAIQKPNRLQVLVLAGICNHGTREETAKLLAELGSFSGLRAVSLRFSVPTTFGSILPLRGLLALRRAWPLVGHFALRDTSIHGFDYWPVQMTDFKELYPHGHKPDPFEVFSTEFRHVLIEQYAREVGTEWAKLSASEKEFWADIARMLPTMPHSEVRRRVTELFPSSL